MQIIHVIRDVWRKPDQINISDRGARCHGRALIKTSPDQTRPDSRLLAQLLSPSVCLCDQPTGGNLSARDPIVRSLIYFNNGPHQIRTAAY